MLTTTITRYNHRIQSLQGEIRGLQDRQNRIQPSLSQKQAELLRDAGQAREGAATGSRG